MKAKKIAVIGAGVSGLGAIKSCLEEGLEPTCFEKGSDIGGLWRYEETPDTGRAGIYKSLTCNTSKEMTAFSDYPVPDHFPNYMHNSKMMEYLRMYARHFGLMQHIEFLVRKVCSVRKRPDFSSSGQWDVVVEADGKQQSYIFDGVMICSGHYTEKHLPLQEFAGPKQRGHSMWHWNFQSPEPKRTLCKGLGFILQIWSVTNTAVWLLEASLQPHKTIFPYLSRDINLKKNRYYGAFEIIYHNFFINKIHSTFSDDLPNRIITGKVRMKPNVKEFTETSAIFEDGTEEKVDTVLFATGYTFSFPFLEDDLAILDSQHSMYKFVFPPQLEKPTLAFIGLLQPVGALIPTTELQSRWAVRVFQGLKKLPSETDMLAEINRRKTRMAKEFVDSPRGASRVYYIDYMDEIASELGVKPNLLSLFLWDAKLAREVFYGPCTPYQYRLQGPGKWTGARAAILTQRARILKPLRTRVLQHSGSRSSGWLWVRSVCAVIFLSASMVIILQMIGH
uniref:Flavin-containing monooxygenase n=1 Tax=Marmota marmota marmota TaxID=9994 RepID=A0A8C6EY21_MARMA